MTNSSGIDFTAIYNEYSDNVFRYIFYMVNDPHVAEDLTQDSFIKVYKNLHTFKFKSNINTWVFKISRNVTLDYLKRKKLVTFFNHDALINNVKSENKTVIEAIVQSEEIKALYSSLQNLKKDYREVLVLRKINECSIRETAIILNWSENKVKSMTSRALIKLKEDLIKKEVRFSESQ
ncbi:RNA polymerase sigma factor [Sporosarcina sp. 179-K 8C2 HS]|uniref:RNA polymerase sigma factor n=1 Tax=Sporosarcina sp. 179-K 8C2 HS TaxID=3142387 RepID=UPI0039A19080